MDKGTRDERRKNCLRNKRGTEEDQRRFKSGKKEGSREMEWVRGTEGVRMGGKSDVGRSKN